LSIYLLEYKIKIYFSAYIASIYAVKYERQISFNHRIFCGEYAWAKPILNSWEVADDIARPVKAAIINRKKDGHFSV